MVFVKNWLIKFEGQKYNFLNSCQLFSLKSAIISFFHFREEGAKKEVAERKARQEAKEAEDRMKAELERQRERKKKEEEERIRLVKMLIIRHMLLVGCAPLPKKN